MGNVIFGSCLEGGAAHIKLYLYDGTTRIIDGKRRLVAEIMLEFPDCMVYEADAFFIGQPLPSLKFDEQLIKGGRYLVLPLHTFPPDRPLSASSLAVFASITNLSAHPAFQYLKGEDGENLMKVSPEFLIKLMMWKGKDTIEDRSSSSSSSSSQGSYDKLCSTPELKKHYDHLVGCREHVWSPTLETIVESKLRSSAWLCNQPKLKLPNTLPKVIGYISNIVKLK